MNSNSLEEKINDGEENNMYDFGNCVDQITNDNQKFVIKVNISHFTPDEISVNIIDDSIVIEGSHKEKNDDYGTIQRHFIRKYSLPNNIDTMSFTTTFQNGILSISGKKKLLNSIG
ncbi:Protein lethal(2)essential for life [Strongyloides ratti]|uniref:Protein lethal(2)essential for life n=1 Tax=Strongyloides ratti TaxID=34506 RepID=A0A090MZT2_STRRB|nr:Protein lethal(2)essential for life [Strongyloides ratti]CEF69479.1 Protein lethal(2)essential for life [Strongyloides ratti]